MKKSNPSKTSIALALAAPVAAISLAFAAPALAASNGANPFAGPYAGAQVGHDSYQYDFDNLYGQTLDGAGAHGIEGGVYLGYDMPVTNQFFVGLEGSADTSNAEFNAALPGPVNFTAKTKNSFAVTARAGFLLNNSTGLYAKVGWADSKLETYGSDGSSWESYKSGVRYGGGIETFLTPQVSVRAEYDITDYGHVQPGMRVTNNQVQLGIGYHF